MQIELTPERKAKARQAAAGATACVDVEIDTDADVQPADDGCWVAAWIFVYEYELENHDD